jgi:hypothetical protein
MRDRVDVPAVDDRTIELRLKNGFLVQRRWVHCLKALGDITACRAALQRTRCSGTDRSDSAWRCS